MEKKHYGRREDPTPILCTRCGWEGTVMASIHTYQDDGTGEDVEPVDDCPDCGATEHFVDRTCKNCSHLSMVANKTFCGTCGNIAEKKIDINSTAPIKDINQPACIHWKNPKDKEEYEVV